jgi:hypothetical protein
MKSLQSFGRERNGGERERENLFVFLNDKLGMGVYFPPHYIPVTSLNIYHIFILK